MKEPSYGVSIEIFIVQLYRVCAIHLKTWSSSEGVWSTIYPLPLGITSWCWLQCWFSGYILDKSLHFVWECNGDEVFLQHTRGSHEIPSLLIHLFTGLVGWLTNHSGFWSWAWKLNATTRVKMLAIQFWAGLDVQWVCHFMLACSILSFFLLERICVEPLSVLLALCRELPLTSPVGWFRRT